MECSGRKRNVWCMVEEREKRMERIRVERGLVKHRHDNWLDWLEWNLDLDDNRCVKNNPLTYL